MLQVDFLLLSNQLKAIKMSFGESQLKKYGWKEGKGLGREENGISKALKPKFKFDKCGLGQDQSEEYTFQWWDHVYNKAANNISVKKNEAGKIELVKSEFLNISTKKSSLKSSKKKTSSTYGNFVKSCVIDGDKIISVVNESTEDQSAGIEEKSLELIKTFSDKELFQMCGGLTAHKGSRHGITMSAKLARLEQQEKEFLDSQSNNTNEKKAKKRKRKQLEELNIVDVPEEECENLLHECETIKSKKKKRKQIEESNTVDLPIEVCENITDCETIKSKKSKKKKRKHRDDMEDELICENVEEVTATNMENNDIENDSSVKSKHKKKKKKGKNRDNDI